MVYCDLYSFLSFISKIRAASPQMVKLTSLRLFSFFAPHQFRFHLIELGLASVVDLPAALNLPDTTHLE